MNSVGEKTRHWDIGSTIFFLFSFSHLLLRIQMIRIWVVDSDSGIDIDISTYVMCAYDRCTSLLYPSFLPTFFLGFFIIHPFIPIYPIFHSARETRRLFFLFGKMKEDNRIVFTIHAAFWLVGWLGSDLVDFFSITVH